MKFVPSACPTENFGNRAWSVTSNCSVARHTWPRRMRLLPRPPTSERPRRASVGSRHEDSFREVVRLSLEANVSIEGRQVLRSEIVELSREFVEDLPATKQYQAAVNNFLRSLSFRARQPNPSQFLTLSGVPLALEIHRSEEV